MGFIIYLIVGGVLGWLASIVMKTDGQQGIFLNVIVGIVGAFLASLFTGTKLSGNSVFDPLTLLYAFIGAVVLLAIVNLVRRGSVR